MKKAQLDQIIRLYGPDILRFCRITTGSKEEGDELYQDTMLMLLEKQDVLDDTRNVKSYAISVALKLWKNKLRKFTRRLRLVPQESLEDLAQQGFLPGESDSPEEFLIRNDQTVVLRKLVQELPESYRLPLQLHYSADMSVKDIARLLSLPENTVKSRLRRAKDKLRAKLEEMEYDRTTI